MRLLEFFRPFRIVGTRRVSEEEQVSVEVFARTRDVALDHLDTILASFRRHRKITNEEVVRATQQQLTALDTAIKQRGEQLAALDALIEKRRQHPLARGQSVAELKPVGPGNGSAS